jgi:hypothetical protein
VVDAAHLHGVPVLGGGRVMGLDPRRAIRLGADGWAATVTDAVTVLDGWQDRPPQLSAASTMFEPAALHLDASSASLAATAFDRLVVEFPRMTSYNDEQLARTREDLAFIVQFVAAARLVDDPDVLTQFLAWLRTLLGNRGLPPQALDAGLRVLAPLIGDLDIGPVVVQERLDLLALSAGQEMCVSATARGVGAVLVVHSAILRAGVSGPPTWSS